MKKTIKIISGIFLIIAGWLSLGIGFTIECPHPCNTAIFLGGFFLITIGILVLVIKSKQHTTRNIATGGESGNLNRSAPHKGL